MMSEQYDELIKRLEGVAEIGVTAELRDLARQSANALKALQAESARAKEFHARELADVTDERDVLQAKLTALEKQEPTAWQVTNSLATNAYNRIPTLNKVEPLEVRPGVKVEPLYLAAGAAPASTDRDAYEGAREDLLDWKRHALEAGAALREPTHFVVAKQHPTLPEVSIFPTNSSALADEYKANGWTVLPLTASALEAVLEPSAPANAAVPEGYRLVPDWKGYALLGSGLYAINHSADFDPALGAELIITLATEEEKAGREIGESRDYPEGRPPIQSDDMVIRIGFLSERALFALEDQLSEIRKLHFTAKESVHSGTLPDSLFGIGIAAPQPPANEPEKRPVNCGTTHCSCIECVVEPASEPAREPKTLIWSVSDGGASVSKPYMVSERVDGKGWNATALFDDGRYVTIALAVPKEVAISAAENYAAEVESERELSDEEIRVARLETEYAGTPSSPEPHPSTHARFVAFARAVLAARGAR